MFKIGDFSRLGQISVRMLRHYDDLGLLHPAYVDPATEYRYYTIEQLPRLNRILALKDLGLSLEQIAQLLHNDLPIEQLNLLLHAKQNELQQHLHDTQQRLNRIANRLRQIELEEHPLTYDVVLKSVPDCCIASVRQVVPTTADMPKYRGMLSRQLYAWLNEQDVAPSGSELVLYHLDDYRETDIDTEFAIAIDLDDHALPDLPSAPITIRQLPAVEQMASVIHSGMLREITQAITALFSWIGTNGYTTSGAFREIHLFGQETIRVRDEPVVVELQIPIERL